MSDNFGGVSSNSDTKRPFIPKLAKIVDKLYFEAVPSLGLLGHIAQPQWGLRRRKFYVLYVPSAKLAVTRLPR